MPEFSGNHFSLTSRNNWVNKLDYTRIDTPCFVVDEIALQRNLDILDSVQQRTGAKILLALKGFAMWSLADRIQTVLRGTCASSPDEARLGREEFGGEVAAFAAAYSEQDIDELITYADHIIFNSFSQWKRYRPKIPAASIDCGLRINPEYSEVDTEIYDPCAKYSRLGIPQKNFDPTSLDGISGLHFHTHCEQNSDTLERTLTVVEAKFGEFLPRMKWVNFGGGHHITREDYDSDKLCTLINEFRNRYDVDVYLEPGEAVGLNTGVLVAEVLDIIENEMNIAILNTSAPCHMPDVLEMPYRPQIVGACPPGDHPHLYKLTGLSCLAGDQIGDYSFKEPLRAGDRLIFLDMAHYSMVKTNTFNGIQLPSIAISNSETGDIRIIRRFGYEDFKNRLS